MKRGGRRIPILFRAWSFFASSNYFADLVVFSIGILSSERDRFWQIWIILRTSRRSLFDRNILFRARDRFLESLRNVRAYFTYNFSKLASFFSPFFFLNVLISDKFDSDGNPSGPSITYFMLKLIFSSGSMQWRGKMQVCPQIFVMSFRFCIGCR